MYNGMSILAVVPARGGSKEVPRKNLRKIGGRSLVALVGAVTRELTFLDRAIVSTDHDDIAKEGEKNGLAAPFRRPVELSGDRIGDIEILHHALTTIEAIDGAEYDVIVMLQPTSPLRRTEHVRSAVRLLLEEQRDSVWSVSKTDIKAHPLKQLVVGDNGHLRYYDPKGAEIVARQQLTSVYHRNGVVYVLTRRCILEHQCLLPNNSAAIVITEPVINIDTEEDIKRAERLITSHGVL